jgi:O-antigen/teichoic acid export membrane protein
VSKIPYRQFAKDVITIGVTQLLTALSAFLLLPIITKSLTVHDYGIWAQIWVTVSLLTPLAQFGITQAMIRYLAAQTDLEKIKDNYYSCILFTIISGSIISLIVFLLSDNLALFVFQDQLIAIYLRLAAFLILFVALYQISSLYFRIFQLVKIYAMLTITQALGHLFLVFALLMLGFGLLGVIIATLVIYAVMFFISVILAIHRIGIKIPEFSEMRDILKYGLPLTPNPMIDWLRTSSDRYIIAILIGISAVGIYSSAYTIASIILMLVSPLQIILFPALSKIYDEGNLSQIKNYLAYSIKYFLLIAIPSAFGISVLATPLLLGFTTPDYISGAILIPFIAFGGVFFGVYQISINVTQLVKKTKFNLYLYIIAAVSSILLNVTLIPILGLIGAGFSAFISFGVMVCLSLFLSFRYIKFPIDIAFLGKSIISSLLMVGIIFLINPMQLFEVIISIFAGIIVYSISILLLRGLRTEEIALFKSLILNIIGWT